MEEKDTLSDDQQTPSSDDLSSQNGNRGKLGNGIAIFVGLNVVLWILTQFFTESNISMLIGWGAMLMNVIILITLARYRRAEAGGMLGAFVALLILTFIIAPICWLTQCFISAMNNL